MTSTDRRREHLELALLTLAAIAALVYGMELAARALNAVDGAVRWEIPAAAVVLALAGRLVSGQTAPWPGRWRLVAVVGTGVSLLVTGTGALSGSGIGRLQVEVIAAGVIVPVAAYLGTRPRLVAGSRRLAEAAATPSPSRLAAPAGLIVVLVAATVAWALLLGTPIGHDEAVYALKARSWLEGTPATGFGYFRPIGMPAVAWVILQVSHAETALRLFGLLGLLGLAAMTWFFARKLYGAPAAFVAAATLVGAPSVLRRTPEFLNDLATSALTVLIAFLLWRHFEIRPDRIVLLVTPLALASFYLRYGSLAGLGAVALAAVLVWPRPAWKSRWRLLLAAGLFLVGLVPHALYSRAETGSITGVLDAAGRVAGPDFPGEGLVDFVAWSPSRLAGPLAATIGAVGIAAAAVAVTRRSPSTRVTRGTVFLVAAGLLQVVVLGIFSHAEERFVFMAVAMLLIAGSGGLAALARFVGPAPRVAAFAALVVALGLTYAFSVRSVDRQLAGVATSRAVLVDVSETVAAAAGPDCVVLTSSIPEIVWYSACAAYRHDSRVGRQEVQEASDGFIVLFDNQKDDALRSPVEQLLRQAGRPLFVPSSGGSVGDARIWRLP